MLIAPFRSALAKYPQVWQMKRFCFGLMPLCPHLWAIVEGMRYMQEGYESN